MLNNNVHHLPNIVYNLAIISRGNHLEYYIPTQVGETNASERLGKLTRAVVHSIAMTACTCPKSIEPRLYWIKTRFFYLWNSGDRLYRLVFLSVQNMINVITKHASRVTILKESLL